MDILLSFINSAVALLMNNTAVKSHVHFLKTCIFVSHMLFFFFFFLSVLGLTHVVFFLCIY
jgi:hypothetical protein